MTGFLKAHSHCCSALTQNKYADHYSKFYSVLIIISSEIRTPDPNTCSKSERLIWGVKDYQSECSLSFVNTVFTLKIESCKENDFAWTQLDYWSEHSIAKLSEHSLYRANMLYCFSRSTPETQSTEITWSSWKPNT